MRDVGQEPFSFELFGTAPLQKARPYCWSASFLMSRTREFCRCYRVAANGATRVDGHGGRLAATTRIAIMSGIADSTREVPSRATSSRDRPHGSRFRSLCIGVQSRENVSDWATLAVLQLSLLHVAPILTVRACDFDTPPVTIDIPARSANY